MTIDERLKEKGIELADPPVPTASYVPCVTVGNLVYVSGQGPVRDGKNVYEGTVGKDITPEEAQKAARLCGCNILAQMKKHLGSLERIKRIVNLKGYVACTDDFKGQAVVVNGASDLMKEVLGDNGAHTRCALGTNSLPTGIPVEVEAVFEIYEQR
ncbi:RidA family protein [Diplocloster agilis]|uniref:RidA family protein n=1 Tax=Diplocloster agilis TaxID=2850323 RepID=UPI000823214D|nr:MULTISPECIES: RidA family protein [Lachnospiraceae]MBU9743223.1 RidA family protein [Diplocloster agilis]MCU6736612.1 RidA family protein [Suonthocola fibrivorans]SCJ92210.1 putative endoribonuclease L-PSP [uncultured Clostridium sp.]